VTSLQVARRLETALLVQLLSGVRSRSRDACDDDASSEKGSHHSSSIIQAPSACGDDMSNDARMPRPSTRRAAGLLAAPRAEVIRPGSSRIKNNARSSTTAASSAVSPQRRRYSFYTSSTNALYESDGGDADADDEEAGVVLRGVLINTGPPQHAPRRSSTAVAVPTAPPLAQEARPQLPRKLTQ
jgi:hypothetical protein